MPKRCRRDEACIRNFGHHQQKKQRTTSHEDKENAGPKATPVPGPKPLQTRTFLQHVIPRSPLGLCDDNTDVTVIFLSQLQYKM